MSLLCEANQSLDIYIKRIFFIRLIVMLLVFTLKINNWTKIILILLMDYVKTLPLLLCNTYPTLSTNSMYQELDKILDSLGYVMCYQIIVSKHLLPPKSTKILFAVLSYRLVGLSLFFLTFNRSLLFKIELHSLWCRRCTCTLKLLRSRVATFVSILLRSALQHVLKT